MLELFKMAIQKPLYAIIVTLCIVTITQFLELFEVKVAIAEIRIEQLTDKAVNEQVLRMNDTLIRVDENVNYIKNSQERTAMYIKREIESQIRDSKE